MENNIIRKLLNYIYIYIYICRNRGGATLSYALSQNRREVSDI